MHLVRAIPAGFFLLFALGQVLLGADLPVASGAIGAELLSNGDFTTAKKDPAWPDQWKRKPWITWQNEKGLSYLRFTAKEPGKTYDLGREIYLPTSQDVKALQVTVRYRTRNLKMDAMKDQNARMSFCFFDAVKIKFAPLPDPIIFSDRSADWTSVTTTFRVPGHAVSFAITFGLYQVDAGALDLANISVKSIPESAAPTVTEATTIPNTNIPIRREGDRTIIGFGTPSIWFIHPYVDVLGHDFAPGIATLIGQVRDQGHHIAVGVAENLGPDIQQDEANTIYVFSYKNINYPLPARARRLVFINTWLTSAVEWPTSRAGKKDLVLLGSRTLHNDGDGLATDKDGWIPIQKDDPMLTVTVLDSTGYYLPIAAWREPLLKVILEEQTTAGQNSPPEH